MSQFCTACGTAYTAGKFCAGCGQPRSASAAPVSRQRATARSQPVAPETVTVGEVDDRTIVRGARAAAPPNPFVADTASSIAPPSAVSVPVSAEALVAEALPAWTPTTAPITSTARPAAHLDAATLASADRSWSGRWSRGLRLCRMSFDLLKAQPGLLAVPIITSAVILAVLLLVAGFVALVGAGSSIVGLFIWIAGLAVMATVGVVGQSIICHRVMAQIAGARLSNSEALDRIRGRLPVLARWAVLSLSVSIAIRTLERSRASFLLRIFGAILDVAWTATTFFVLPVLLFEGLDVRPAIRRSREIVRTSWGEGVIGVGALTLLFNAVGLGLFVLCILLAAAHALILAVLLFVVTVVGINLMAAVTSPIYTVALYRFATSQELILGFDALDLAAAFKPRRGASLTANRN